MRLLLIRHGQTPSNVAGALDTAAPGPGLTELGERQAAAVPDAVADQSIEAIYVSILVRTHLTAAPLADRLGLDPIELPGIHEIEAGDLEMHTDKESVRTYLSTLVRWGEGDFDLRIPGGPNAHEFFARFDADIARIADEHAGGTAVAFSHGAAIRMWVGGRVSNATLDFMVKSELDNTGLVVVDGDPQSGWTMSVWNGEPIGGESLADDRAVDPMGEPT